MQSTMSAKLLQLRTFLDKYTQFWLAMPCVYVSTYFVYGLDILLLFYEPENHIK